MNILQRRGGPVEKISLETHQPKWIVVSIGGCGILTRALIGRHEKQHNESQIIALAFAHHVIQAINLAPFHGNSVIPQILVDTANVVIDDPEYISLLCTTWRYLPEGVEICSVGPTSVLAFEEKVVREVITPHTVNEFLKSQGKATSPIGRNIATHTLGSKDNEKSCVLDDVRVALVPLTEITTIAIMEDRLLVDAILEHSVPGNELSSFIEAWNPTGIKLTTSVLISW
ncbi:hypothetical protein KSC_057040 [Ktedonobacter sp. SOSP1-52]|uniref:hypothetical protein n=1 Tax=Ktedonobacter sp. SOSP1-52 TaxID=2778366 RepID=UPI00191541B3|nr:hypothetical protein [Ktedonobacter sp. SOSP1-52]GHO66812.1 hypothetical protein KSC_057040 [Ktedonobacter sp. SOSP1-52]